LYEPDTADTWDFILLGLLTAKFGQLNSVTKIDFELQKLNIYGEQQGTLFLNTKEKRRSFRRTPYHTLRRQIM
jgi:hypothetical protein